MSTTSKAGKVAVGMFLILSVVVFGSILYVGFTSVNTEIVVIESAREDMVTDDDGVRIGEYLLSQDLSIRRGPIEIVPDRRPGLRRGPIELFPDFIPREPPVIRNPRFGNLFDPDYGGIVDPYDPGDAFIE